MNGEWSKKTGYKMAEHKGYTGEKFSPKCFQRKLRETYEVDKTLSLHGELEEIPFKTAQDFILKYEWLGTMGTTKHSYGYYVDGQLAAVFCFGLTAGTGVLAQVFGDEHKHRGIVLVRGACAPNAHKHTASHSMMKCLKKLHDDYGYLFCVAYSDPEAGEIGTVYQATNWLFYGMTAPITYLVRPDGKRVDPRIIYKYAKKNGVTSKEQRQAFYDEGYTTEKGSPKLKYLKLFGNKRENKNLMKHIRVPTYPYLKRKSDMREIYVDFKNLKFDKSLEG